VVKLLELAKRREPHLYPALRFALGTGVRRGELLALRWQDVDFDRGRVHIRRTLRPSGGTKVPKSSRDRFVPLPSELLTLLRERRTAHRRATLMGLPEQEWVFPSPRGKLWAERNFERMWYRLRRRATDVRPLKLHCTRHTYITWALEAGISPKRVAEWVGASIAVIERHYAHVIPTADDDLSFTEVSTGHKPVMTGQGIA
jgi:integrase